MKPNKQKYISKSKVPNKKEAKTERIIIRVTPTLNRKIEEDLQTKNIKVYYPTKSAWITQAITHFLGEY